MHDILYALDVTLNTDLKSRTKNTLGQNIIDPFMSHKKQIIDYVEQMGRGLQKNDTSLYFSEYCTSLMTNEDDDHEFYDKSKEMKQRVITVYQRLFFYALLALASMGSSIFVAYAIYRYKELRGHPNMLIFYLSIANIMTCWSLLIYIIGTPDFVCYFGNAEMLSYTLKPLSFFFLELTTIDAIQWLNYTNMLIFEIF